MSSAGVSLKDLPKSSTFTKSLPPDPAFPTPESSAAAPRSSLGPRMVKEALFTYVTPTPPSHPPELLAISPRAFKSLGLSLSEAKTAEFRSMVAGGKSGFEDEVYPWAQCYGGWQFGSWAGQLGDGRAISLFEATNPESGGERYEVQLKGAGKTPYSRFADGKAVLRSSIREFIVSEYLNAIGIRTTRALSLSLIPGEKVVREKLEPAAIVCRMAQSWIRIGTFDLLRWRGDRTRLRILADYVRNEVLKMPVQTETLDEQGRNRYENMYREIVRLNALTVARWQVHGFMNGVLNTDNTSIFGLSLDFGPFAFMDTFDPDYTPNHDDHMLRYSFKNQPTIIWWNLVRLGEDLAELFGAKDPDDETFKEKGVQEEELDEFVKRAEGIIENVGEMYKETFLTEYKRLMAERLGFKSLKDTDMDEIFSTVLNMMQKCELDFHQFFRKLAEVPVSQTFSAENGKDNDDKATLELAEQFVPSQLPVHLDPVYVAQEIRDWLRTYATRLASENITDEERMQKMKQLNPKFVPKNWVLDELISRVEKGEREVLRDVVALVQGCFEEDLEKIGVEGWVDGEMEWKGLSETGKKDAVRWWGEVPRMRRAMQCSCSS